MEKKIEQMIQEAEKQVKDSRGQIAAEQKRLKKFGSKEAYYNFLPKEKELDKALGKEAMKKSI